MATKKHTAYPLRKIVEIVNCTEGKFGSPLVLKERLECGHLVRIKNDIYGPTNAERRRCRACATLATAPALGSIITLTAPVLDFDGDELPVGLDVVVLETHEDGSILVNEDKDDSPEARAAGTESVDAWVHDGEWMQRPEERR